MEVRDLRLDNLVISPQGIGKVTSIQDREVLVVDEVGYVIEECQGIPITEEWLLKFGFEKMKYPYLDYDMNECDLFESDWGNFYQVENFYLPTPYYFDSAFGENFKLEHVHQLQNLYHSLTGKELTIKE